MKIAMYNVTTLNSIGGIETYCLESSTALSKMGHDVDIISGIGDLKGDNRLFKIHQFSFKSRKNFINLGNRFRKFSERVSFFFNARKFLKANKYDIFFVHKPLDFFVCFFLKRLNQNTKTVFVSGGEDFYGFDKFFSRYIDVMISVSDNNALKISSRYNRKVNVLPNGVDLKKFQKNKNEKKFLKKDLNLSEDKKILMSVGRIVALKGYQTVIQNMKNIDKNIVYVIIGSGIYLNNLKVLVKEYNLEKRVFFLGAIKHEKLYKYLSEADVFIQPTIGNEAFGITVIEAMACSLPIIATKNGGMVEVIEENKNGFLYNINNFAEMSDKIYLAFNSSLDYEYVRKGLYKKYSWELIMKETLQLVQQVEES